jgi:hypothetical protein
MVEPEPLTNHNYIIYQRNWYRSNKNAMTSFNEVSTMRMYIAQNNMFSITLMTAS